MGDVREENEGRGRFAPLDLKPGHAGLGADVPNEAVKEDGFRGRDAVLHLVVVVLGVLVVSDADELLVLVRAGEDEGGDAEDVLLGDGARVGRGALELERVDPDRDRPDEAVVELLVELLLLWRGDVDELPFEVCWVRACARVCVRESYILWAERWKRGRTVFERSDALKSDSETVRIGETRWVVEELDVLFCFADKLVCQWLRLKRLKGTNGLG